MPIESVNPASGELVATYQEMTAEELESDLARAADTFRDWRETSFAQRSEVLRRTADTLRERKTKLAYTITTEMGKPISEAEAEVEKCAWNCEFYAENAETFLAPEPVDSAATKSYVRYDPLGAIFAIMPWNFPFWQVFRFAAPCLMAGNTAILKHASNVPGCSLAITEVFEAAGAPAGVFQSMLITGPTAEKLIADDRIAAVTLTGSDATGARVASAAGKSIKKAVLELGGSDPFIVFADADVSAASRTAVRARNQNAGQSCIAAKRFIVVREVVDEFTDLFAEKVGSLRVGDPLDTATQVGPLARQDLRDDLDDQVKRTVAAGARVVTGGAPGKGAGFFYEPTVLSGVSPAMAAGCEETFGPVAAVIEAVDAEDAIAIANDSAYGLGASIWTRDVDWGETVASRIETGAVFINGLVASDPRLPFGGIKRSGYGRELGRHGIREFVNVKTVWVA
ncbi:MAG TPA: NAD-dependent succinate-semialdehyde dehydrogenase [Dehalococcoidia bacterium]|nr:NAD-dependent succinate-semialdehyde dehydrogenase [Dehalococcoidia bacterium]